jgi:hypothetical protein
VSSAVNAGQDHGRVGQQDRACAPEDLGVGDAQEPAEVLIFGFVEGEQTITLRLKNRRIGGQGLALTGVDLADVDRKGELRPGRLNLAVRKEEAIHNPARLAGQLLAARDVLPSPESGKEHSCSGDARCRDMVRVHARLADRVHRAGPVLSNQRSHLEPQPLVVGQKAVLMSEGQPLDAENASSFGCLSGALAARGEIRRLALGQIDEQNSLAALRQFRQGAPIWVSASSGWAVITRAS